MGMPGFFSEMVMVFDPAESEAVSAVSTPTPTPKTAAEKWIAWHHKTGNIDILRAAHNDYILQKYRDEQLLGA